MKVQKISQDKSPFHKVHRPHDPAADAQGYIEKTNVNSLIEMADLREAMQSHAANLEVYKASTSMRNETIQALKV